MVRRAATSGGRPPTSLNYVDTHWLFRLVESLKLSEGRQVTLNYRELLKSLGEARKTFGLSDADASLAPAAVDVRSESQQRFVEALKQIGFVVDPIDYRATFVSNPPGDDKVERGQTSTLAHYAAYMMGLLAERESPEIVLVTGAFELYLPLLDFTRRRGGRAVLAFFRRYLDPRWIEIGRIGETDAVAPFYDLEQRGEALLGGALKSMAPDIEATLPGLGRL